MDDILIKQIHTGQNHNPCATITRQTTHMDSPNLYVADIFLYQCKLHLWFKGSLTYPHAQ